MSISERANQWPNFSQGFRPDGPLTDQEQEELRRAGFRQVGRAWYGKGYGPVDHSQDGWTGPHGQRLWGPR